MDSVRKPKIKITQHNGLVIEYYGKVQIQFDRPLDSIYVWGLTKAPLSADSYHQTYDKYKPEQVKSIEGV